MNPIECELESEVLAGVLQNRWPEQADASLREHVAARAICADVVAIAGAIDGGSPRCAPAAKPPRPPVVRAQVIALACAMGLLGACFGATSAWFQSALHRTASSLTTIKFQALLPFAGAFFADHGALLLAMAAIVLIVPAAVYLTMLRE